MTKGAQFWRQAGMSYLQYLSVSSKAVRSAVKVFSCAFCLNFKDLYRIQYSNRDLCPCESERMISSAAED